MKKQEEIRLEKMESEMKKVSDPVAEREEHLKNKEKRASHVPEPGFSNQELIQLDMDLRKMADFLDLDTSKIEAYADKLNVLKGWAESKTKSNSVLDSLKEIKKLRRKLGFQEVGETGLKKLYQYARLEADALRVKKEMELLKE